MRIRKNADGGKNTDGETKADVKEKVEVKSAPASPVASTTAPKDAAPTVLDESLDSSDERDGGDDGGGIDPDNIEEIAAASAAAAPSKLDSALAPTGSSHSTDVTDDSKDDALDGQGRAPTDEEKELIRGKADEWIDKLSAIDPSSPEFKSELENVTKVGRKYFEHSERHADRFMQASLASSSRAGGEGSQAAVSKGLMELRTKIDEITPEPSTSIKSRILDILPGGRFLKHYFRRFETNQTQIDSIVNSLERSKDGLIKDNAELMHSRQDMWQDMGGLRRLYVLLDTLDDSINEKIKDAKEAGNTTLADALTKDALFAVRQRKQDVETQIAVSAQAYLSIGVIIENNEHLVNGVDRAHSTTMTALRTTVELSQALQNQRMVLRQIDEINSTTNRLMKSNSSMLKDNSIRVQQQSVNSGVDPEVIRQAFQSVAETLDGLDQYRARANITFNKNIAQLRAQMDRVQPYLERQSGTVKGMDEITAAETENPLEIDDLDERDI